MDVHMHNVSKNTTVTLVLTPFVLSFFSYVLLISLLLNSHSALSNAYSLIDLICY